MLLAILTLGGCGKENATTGVTPDCTAPFGSIITLEPSPAAITPVGGLPTSADILQNLTVLVQYPDKSPMPKACISISGNQARPAANYAYTFYYNTGGNADPSNPAVNSGYVAQTDDYGKYYFSVVISAGTGTFSDTITVNSGANSGNTHLELPAGT